tara:strand:- start:2242 stop:2919 length:678 start_codon:yes stop_codon:yes gene_type:complete
MNFDDYNFTKPGHIVEYFPVTQTATVRISNDTTYSTSFNDDLTVVPVLLYDVPTFTPGGGNYHITFPIKAGDPCLLTFSEFGYDHWFVDDVDAAGIRSDGHPQPWTRRKFSLADGFCQVGWNNLKTAIEGYSANDSEWRNIDRAQRITLVEDGNIHIATGSTTVNIAPDGNVTIVSPVVTMSGDLAVAGTITAAVVDAPSVLAGGIEVAGHDHINPEGGNTGPMK